MLTQVTACMLTVLALTSKIPLSTAPDLPAVFEIDSQPFAILKEPEHFQYLSCFPPRTYTVFFDLGAKYTDQLTTWIDMYHNHNVNWKYVTEEQEIYDWFASHLENTP